MIGRLDAARETVRSREAMQHDRLEDAESAGQWIRLYERQLVQIEEDLAATDADSPRAARLQTQRADLLRKLDKRRRQQAEHLRTSGSTVVTLPTAMVADLLGQLESTTRGADHSGPPGACCRVVAGQLRHSAGASHEPYRDGSALSAPSRAGRVV